MLQWEEMALKSDGLEHEGLAISAGTSPGCQGLQIAPKTCRGGTNPCKRPGAGSQSLRCLPCLCFNKSNNAADVLQTSANNTMAIKRRRAKTIVFHAVGAGKPVLRARKSRPNKHDPEWDLQLRQAHSQPTQTGKDEMHLSQTLHFNSFP